MAESSKRGVPKERWRPFFDEVSDKLKGKGVDITLSTGDGPQHQSRLWQLHGVTYDPHDDALIVSCRQQEHVISSPTSVVIEGYGREVSSMEVTTEGGERETVRFMDPLLLSAT
jgi:Family of unknown function (DUF5335)